MAKDTANSVDTHKLGFPKKALYRAKGNFSIRWGIGNHNTYLKLGKDQGYG